MMGREIPSITIKVKNTGAVTVVTKQYFDKYVNEGWFIEVPAEEPKKVPAKKE